MTLDSHDGSLWAGDIELRLTQRQLSVAGKPVPLGARAFDVLLALVACQGRVASKSELIAAAWPDVVVEGNNLQVQISALRKVLGPAAIVTVPGRGYQLTIFQTEVARVASTATGSVDVAVPTGVEPLLAVLPFDNLSNDPEMQFFSDGVAEEILQVLARSSGLSVIGRTSSFQFRGERKADAAGALKATHILDGSVRRSGARMRVSVQLSETAKHQIVWTDRFDRDVADAFDMQEEIAGQVAAALTHALPATRRRLPRIDPIAYDLYLRARPLVFEGLDADLEHAQSLLEQAVSRAPDAADVWALLARVRADLLPKDHDSTRESTFDATRVAAERALALDPKSTEAMVALALLKPAFAEHDEKLRLISEAGALAPNDPLIGSIHAQALSWVGRCGEALVLRERMVRLEPLSSFRAAQYAAALSATDHVDQSIAVIEEAWRRLPHTPWLWGARLAVHLYGGRIDDAARMCALPECPDEIAQQLGIAVEALRMPLPQRELRIYELTELTRGLPLNINFCLVVAFGEFSDFALDLLSDALRTGRPIQDDLFSGRQTARALLLCAMFDSRTGRALQRNVRFPEFCAQVGLVDYWRQSDKWPDCMECVPYDFKAACEQAAQRGEKR